MKKNYVVRLIIILLVVLCLLYFYSSFKKISNNEAKIEVLNNNKVKEQITISELMDLSSTNKKEFDKKYKNSKVIITDTITNIMINHIDNNSSYSTAYDVIFLKNNVKVFIGHGKYDSIEDLNVGDKINVESRLVSCDEICIVRDIKYKDDAGFNYEDYTKINIVKGK